MNAYELAVGLENHFKNNFITSESALLLRQQADRIGVLEANHEIQKNINDKALQYIEQLEQGLRASIDLNNAQATRTTPQTKPLSDFEIRGIMAQDECWIGEDCSMPDLIRFARAIEERHGIK